VRVVGYVREAPDPREGEPAFAQSERIRRWATDAGHLLVAICQDLRLADGTSRRQGLRAVMGIISGGVAQAVVVPELSVLSPDKVVQEIMIRDLRDRGATVVSISEDDHADLDESTPDRLRMIVRDVLARIDEHQERFFSEPIEETADDEPDDQRDNVIVELISPEPPEPVERIRPVR
jgi:DNA invertase Pin-like site-specific DNA recombinase